VVSGLDDWPWGRASGSNALLEGRPECSSAVGYGRAMENAELSKGRRVRINATGEWGTIVQPNGDGTYLVDVDGVGHTLDREALTPFME
jgi:hypothetical protein